MNDLFIDIMMNLTAELYQNGEKDINSMLLEQKQNRDFLLQAIASIILFKPVKNEFMELSNKDYFESKKALDKLIKDNFTIEAKSEVKALDKIIEKTAKDKWGINDYVTNLGKDAGVKPIDKKVIDKIKNDKVAGKTAKSRIWNNKDEVYKHTQKRVDEFLKGKISVNDIEKEIKTLYNSNAYNTKRLVNDQIARAQAKANEEWFKENDVEWLLYDATLDGKTCSDCSGLDGKTYQKNKDRPPIPKHVGCRCCYIGLPDKDWRPEKRIDNENGENIDYQKYQEWYDDKYKLHHNNVKISKKDIQNDYTVDRKIVNSQKFHEKFENLPVSKNAKESLYSESKKILEHRDGTGSEDIVIIDSKTGKEIVSNRTSNENLATGITKEQYDEIQKYDKIILLHNHPGGGRLSYSDIKAIYNQKNVEMSIVAGHDGSIHYIYNMDRSKDIEKIYQYYYTKYKKETMNSDIARIRATDELYNLKLFDYIEK
ncbi:MAG: minor capsid protein [Filifactoraceae bacterium]